MPGRPALGRLGSSCSFGLASVPQAAASGFRGPYLIPDTATAALGILLAVTVLATAGRMDRRDTTPEILLAKRR
jgi:hypothetical protein